jgi:hypothetical protein
MHDSASFCTSMRRARAPSTGRVNSEKGLPVPFLRRCVYYDIPFPNPDQMTAIVAGRIAGLQTANPFLTDALDLFYRLRHGGRETSTSFPKFESYQAA